AYTLTVANTGKVDSQEVTLKNPIPEGLQYVRSEPAAILDGNQLVWTLAGLPTGSNHTVKVIARPTHPGPITTSAQVTTRDGLHDERSAVTQVTVTRLDIKMTGPETVLVGAPIDYQITVTNTGTGPATNLVLSDEFDDGLEHASQASKR